jgi:hypothetical protein
MIVGKKLAVGTRDFVHGLTPFNDIINGIKKG